MAVLHTLAAIGRFIRRTPPPPADLLEAYAHEVIPVLDRAEWLYEYWLEQSTLFTDGEKLGNVAAIHRWETASMGRSLARVVPPAVLADAHSRVVDALDLASRAAQLLSNGSRFHNANAVCEGHAMLAASRERRLAALRSMHRYLAPVQAEAAAQASAVIPEALAVMSAQNGAGAAEPGTVSHNAAPGAVVTGVETAGTEVDGAPLVALHAADAVDRADADWPDLAGLDLIVTETPEPEPDWLKAARADAPPESPPAPAASADDAPPFVRPAYPDPSPSIPEPVQPAPSASEPAPPSVAPVDRRASDASWGALFGGPSDDPPR